MDGVEKKVHVDELTTIKVIVNEPDTKKLKFEWFKVNTFRGGQPSSDEAIAISLNENRTAHDPIFEITEIDEKDAGFYRCQVTRESTNEKVMSSNFQLILIKKPECKKAITISFDF